MKPGFYKINRVIRCINQLCALILIATLSGCQYYYKVQTVNKVTVAEVDEYRSLDKYIIVHQGDSAWHLSNPRCNNEQVLGTLSELPADHKKYLTTKRDSGNKYKRNADIDEKGVLSEVHLYLDRSYLPAFSCNDSIQFSYSAILSADIYMKDKGRTQASWLIPCIGGTFLGLAVLVSIFAISLSNMNFHISMH